MLANGLQYLNAIPIRQAEIQDHQIGIEMAIQLQPFIDPYRLADLMPFGNQADTQKAANRRFIIYDQYVSHLASRGEYWERAEARGNSTLCHRCEPYAGHYTSGALRASGSEMRMQVPLPLGPENAQIRPPWASIIAREMARPSPVPRLPQSPTGWV